MTDNPSSTELEIIRASEITPKEVRWLWYPYIPFGKITLFQGDPGDGKASLCFRCRRCFLMVVRYLLPMMKQVMNR